MFHHEWKKEEAKEKLKRTVEAYRQFEQGQMPAGPGADGLLASFRAVEKELATTSHARRRWSPTGRSSCC